MAFPPTNQTPTIGCSKVYLVTDYACQGCSDDQLLGVFTTRKLAEENTDFPEGIIEIDDEEE
jgi:hypothetical protein